MNVNSQEAAYIFAKKNHLFLFWSTSTVSWMWKYHERARTHTHNWNLLKLHLARDHLFSKHLFATRKVFSLLIKLKIQYLPAKKQESAKLVSGISDGKTTTTICRMAWTWPSSLHSIYIAKRMSQWTQINPIMAVGGRMANNRICVKYLLLIYFALKWASV